MTEAALEQLLALGIVLIYLLDSMRLLGGGEAAVEERQPGSWRVYVGATRFEITGKRPLVPNPLRPDRPMWLVRWVLEGDAPKIQARDEPPETGQLVRWLGYVSLANLVLVVGIAPATLLMGRTEIFAVAVLFAYLVAIGGATLLIVRAQNLGHTRWSAAGVGVIAAICLPCAPNLLRAALSRQSFAVVLPAFAAAGTKAHGLRRFEEAFTRLLKRELLLLGEDEEAARPVKAMLQRYQRDDL